MGNSTPELLLPNNFGRVFLMSLEESLGQENLNSVLEHAGLKSLASTYPPDNREPLVMVDLFSRIIKSLEDVYGWHGGRGLALIAGRNSFKYCLWNADDAMGIANLEFRLLPHERKIIRGLTLLANYFMSQTNQLISVEEDEGYYLWKNQCCPLCWQRTSHSPVCHYVVGYLQSGLNWLSSGKYYRIKEIECCARGDDWDLFQIDKQYLE